MVRHDTQTIVTIAGKGTAGYSGDGGLARLGVLNVPTSVCVDDSQRDVTGVVQVYFTDSENNRVRRVTYLNQSLTDSSGYPLSQGVISTVVGSSLPFTSFGIDSGGSALKVLSTHLINPPSQYILPVKQHIQPTYSTDAPYEQTVSPALLHILLTTSHKMFPQATLKSPSGVSIDVNGNVLFADTLTHSIRAGLSLAPSASPTYLPTQKGTCTYILHVNTLSIHTHTCQYTCALYQFLQLSIIQPYSRNLSPPALA